MLLYDQLSVLTNIVGGAAHHDVEGSGLDHIFHLPVPERQCFRADLELDCSVFPGFKRYTCKTLEYFNRCRYAAHHIMYIELRNFRSFGGAGVRYLHAHGGGAGRRDLRWYYTQSIIGKLRVAKAMAEGKEWLAAFVYILVAGGGFLVVVQRHLAHGPRECHGQLARWVYIAEQYIGNSKAPGFATEPAFYQRWNVLRNPGYSERPSVYKHGGNRFAGGMQCLEQIELPRIEREIGAVLTFAHHGRVFAGYNNDQVRALRQRYRFS